MKGIEIAKPTQVFPRVLDAERELNQVLNRMMRNEISVAEPNAIWDGAISDGPALTLVDDTGKTAALKYGRQTLQTRHRRPQWPWEFRSRRAPAGQNAEPGSRRSAP